MEQDVSTRRAKDCYNCAHARKRQTSKNVCLTMVCLKHARGVRPCELRDTGTVPCGTCMGDGGFRPRGWISADIDCDKAHRKVTSYGEWGRCVCGRCGKRVDVNDNYCRHCGVMLYDTVYTEAHDE